MLNETNAKRKPNSCAKRGLTLVYNIIDSHALAKFLFDNFLLLTLPDAPQVVVSYN